MTSRQTAQGEEQDEEEEAGAGFRDKGEEGEVKVEAARLSTSALDSNYSYFMPRLGRSQSVTSTPPASASDVTATAQLVSHTDQLSIQNARLNSLAPVMESDSVAVVSPDPNEAVELERSLVYPNQSHAALHSQHHPTRSGVHRQMSSHPGEIHTFFSAFATASNSLHKSGAQTDSHNSPATTPGGLLSPRPRSSGEPCVSSASGTYASPFLHFTHRVPPKETHVADVDVDPATGFKNINHYQIIDELGRGAYGKVKLGRDMISGTHVAIKIVERYSKRRKLGKIAASASEDKVKREVAILKKARHPNIVALLEVIDDPRSKKVYIVLEYVTPGEIKWRVRTCTEIAVLEAWRYERERTMRDDSQLGIEFDVLQREVKQRLDKEKERWARARRANARQMTECRRATASEAWSVETTGGDDDDLSDEDDPSSASPQESGSRIDKPRAPVPDSPISGSHEAKDGRPSHPDLPLLDGPINPELEFVPAMTQSQIRIAFRDTLVGLQYLHYQGIIHRDIKPPNLLATSDGRVKISDFGVSYLGRPLREGESGEDASESEMQVFDGARQLAMTVGTPAFYAPELCINCDHADPPPVTKAIDVWALGITLFCMLFARTPFVDDSFVVMRYIVERPIYIPRKRLVPTDAGPSTGTWTAVQPGKRGSLDIEYEAVNESLRNLLARLLEKDPRKRITLEEVRRHPWVSADLQDPQKWLEETDPERQNMGKKIEVSTEDVKSAVVPLQLLDRMRSGLKRVLGFAGKRERGHSHGQSHELAQAAALQHEDAHLLSRSVTVSPVSESDCLDSDQRSQATPSRPALGTRPTAPAANAGPTQAVKGPAERGREPAGLPEMPVAIESGNGHGLSSVLSSGAARRAIQAIRERSAHRTGLRGRTNSRASPSRGQLDAHGEPSVALSTEVASGQVNSRRQSPLSKDVLDAPRPLPYRSYSAAQRFEEEEARKSGLLRIVTSCPDEDVSRPVSIEGTSNPTSQDVSPINAAGKLPAAMLSSSSDVASAGSGSASNPSMRADDEKRPVKKTIEAVDEGYFPHVEQALDSADEEADESGSDGGLVMRRRQSKTLSLRTRKKERRNTGVSSRSKRSSCSSNMNPR